MKQLRNRRRPNIDLFWECKYELRFDLDKDYLTPYDINISRGVHIRSKPVIV